MEKTDHNMFLSGFLLNCDKILAYTVQIPEEFLHKKYPILQ